MVRDDGKSRSCAALLEDGDRLRASAQVARSKEFATYHLPEQSFLYLLHAMREEKQARARLWSLTTGACS